MATATQALIVLTGTYVDITVANASLVSADVMLQYQNTPGDSDEYAEVIFAATATGGPIRLENLDSIQGNAAKIWVRGKGQISATLV
jgi:hypothetical protein